MTEVENNEWRATTGKGEEGESVVYVRRPRHSVFHRGDTPNCSAFSAVVPVSVAVAAESWHWHRSQTSLLQVMTEAITRSD
jgi:hypothetical protein